MSTKREPLNLFAWGIKELDPTTDLAIYLGGITSIVEDIVERHGDDPDLMLVAQGYLSNVLQVSVDRLDEESR